MYDFYLRKSPLICVHVSSSFTRGGKTRNSIQCISSRGTFQSEYISCIELTCAGLRQVLVQCREQSLLRAVDGWWSFGLYVRVLFLTTCLSAQGTCTYVRTEGKLVKWYWTYSNLFKYKHKLCTKIRTHTHSTKWGFYYVHIIPMHSYQFRNLSYTTSLKKNV